LPGPSSAYRDVRCGKTIADAFSKAKYPDRLFAGAIDQISPTDPKALDVYCKTMKEKGLWKDGECPWKDHVRVDEVSYLESKGPIVARARQPALMKGEHFCMQIDAHSMFVQDWDVKVMKQWMDTSNEYAVLTTYIKDIGQLDRYPADMEEKNLPDDEPLSCQTLYDEEGMVRNDQAANMYGMEKPKLITTWCAGLSFSKCHAESTVPNDPNMKQMFDGEEWSKAVRLWTNGYDM
jgi:hypothetical protein